jgi:hypothetical protein
MWLTSARRDTLSGRRVPSGLPWLDPLIRAASSACHSAGCGREDGIESTVALGLQALICADPVIAASAVRRWLTGQTGKGPAQDLGKAHEALVGAVLFDACGHLWDDDLRREWGEALCARAASFFTVSSANPHHIANNWWAVTHSGLYFAAAALCSAGRGSHLIAGRSVDEIEEWAWLRLDAFLGHFGDQGAYHEGLGYQDYTCSYLLPAVLLRRARSGSDPLDAFPALRRMAALLFCTGIEGPRLDDASEKRMGWGRQLSWNDAGLGWSEGAVPLLAIACADVRQRPALLALWNRLSGHERPDAQVVTRFAALFFQAAFYPDTVTPDTSDGALPHVVCDRKQGLWIARNRYRDSRDAVVGAYARVSHPGGHSQKDAGSIRFSALGWDWVLGGGQARPEAQWQSVVTSSDADAKSAGGALLWQSDSVCAMDLRRAHAGYSERYVALHPESPVALALLDLIDDHRHDRDWIWNLTFSPEHTLTVHDDRSGFALAAPDGATLAVRFLGTRPVAIACVHSPASSRTYASGKRVDYPGRPCIQARFPRVNPLNIYAMLTVSAPGSPVPAPRLTVGTGVAWGDAEWERPFGLALPHASSPGSMRTQCPFPGMAAAGYEGDAR